MRAEHCDRRRLCGADEAPRHVARRLHRAGEPLDRAGAAGALNMWYDADIDALMSRTAKRPIPRGRIAPGEALAFGIVLAAFAVGVLGVIVSWLAVALLAFTIFFYVVVYTAWLKRLTPQNIVIGGAAGSLPPVIAWAAATG